MIAKDWEETFRFRTGRPVCGLILGLLVDSLMGCLVLQAQDGSPRSGLHYFAVENLDRGAVEQRGIAGSNGIAFDTLILAPNTRYRTWLLEAATLRIGRAEFRTGRAGTSIDVPRIRLTAYPTLDSDADGLSDLAENILGTSLTDPDSDGDGVPDGAEVQQGLDPNDGRPARTGIIASVNLPGNASDVCASGDLVVVANSRGITGLNVFIGLNPQVVLRVETPGTATRVACSGRRIAIADSVRGLLIVDATDPPAARIVHQVTSVVLGGTPTSVTAAGDVAYVGLSTGGVVSIDLQTAEPLDRDDLGDQVVDLAVEGGTLHAVTRFAVHALALDPGDLRSLSSAASREAHGPYLRLFVGGGVAYALHLEGYDTFDVADPAQLAPIAVGRTTQVGWQDIAVNGSGLGVAGVINPGIGGVNVSLYNTSDPSRTNEFITSFPTPGSVQAVEIANGLAYVADGGRGLQVVNYLAFDTAGKPPAISLRPSFEVNGVEEGKRVFASAAVADDVQVRSVEFVVDGVATTDPSFPFEHHFTTPRLEAQPSFSLRARAFDTGGNSTWTDELVVTLTADVTPPRVKRVVPPDAGFVPSVRAVTAFVDEPLAPSTLTPASFFVVEAGADRVLGTADDVPVVATTAFREDVLAAVLEFPSALAPGQYLVQLTTAVTDHAGNPLESAVTWSFVLFGQKADDRDRDGVPDVLEPFLGLDPDDPDTDDNGIDDGLEDFDGDGLANAFEFLLGTDPTRPDTDGDGVLDGQGDSDDDGLLDGVEVTLGLDPFRADTDGDGFFDRDEVEVGSDGRDPMSLPLFTAVAELTVQSRAGFRFTASVATVQNVAAPEAVAKRTQPGVLSVKNEGNP